MTSLLNDHLNGDSVHQDVDNRLRGFFRAQMPDPWPGLDLPQPMALPRQSSIWFRAAPRLALAASILMMIAYLALSGMFPKPIVPVEVEDLNHNIGKNIERPTAPRQVKTPLGKEALMEEQFFGPDILIRVQPLPGIKK